MPALVTDTNTQPSLDALVDMTRAGSPTALGALYDLYAPRMLAVARRLTGSQDDAEDVVHDVFVGLPEALRRYDERGALPRWLTQVTARAALMRLRRVSQRREALLAEATVITSRDRADAQLERNELEQAIEQLPEPLRVVFVMREIEGFSHEEIAGLLDISPGASRVRLSRALTALRSTL